MHSFRIGLAQCQPQLGNTNANLALFLQQLERAAHGGADLVLFPELGLSGYRLDREQLQRLAESRDGPSIRLLRARCQALQMACVVSYPEIDQGHYYIAASFIDRNGELVGHYRKTHIYPGEELFRPGAALTTFATSFGRVGLMICYDLEFPEVARTLKLDGAELLLVATANMAPFQQQQRALVQARAFENEVPVAICNRVGQEAELHFFGSSGIAHASGAWAELPPDTATLQVLPVHLESPPYGYQAHRRPELYRT